MREFRRWLRRRRRRLIFLVMRQLLRIAGFKAAQPIGRQMGNLQFRLSWRERKRCQRDLAELLGRPEGDPTVREILRQSYRATLVALLEALAMFDRRQDHGLLQAHCEVDGMEHLREALAAGHGAILLAAHMGNGALVAIRLAHEGWPVSVVYRQARMMSEGIFEHGLPLYGIEGIRANAGIRAYSQMLDALRRGRIVFLMMDQGTKASQDGIMLRFLGKDMPVTAGPAQLARHSGAPMLPLLTTAAEPRWKFTIAAPVERAPGSSLQEDVERLVRMTERHILEYPQLWSWHHRRWRRFPMAPKPA